MKNNMVLVGGIAAVIALVGCAEQKKAEQSTGPASPGSIVAEGSVPAASETQAVSDATQAATASPIAGLQVRQPTVGVQEAVFCTGIANRIPQGVGTSFDKSVKKVFFFTRVTNAKKPTAVTHVWYWKENKMAEVPLEVRSESWRTWSSKKIDPAWTGSWAVKVLDENGEVVTTKNFEII